MITVEDFKNHFTRDFPYLPYWEEGKAYFTGDVVYSAPNFYKSLIDGNMNPVTTNAWELTKDSTDNYLSDDDISKAIAEATMAFNEALFDRNQTEDYIGDDNMALLYLTAFYLVLDIRNSTSGLSSNAYAMFSSNKSVGNVSEGYGIPSWIQNNPMYAIYMTNGYGLKYLSMVIPKITGYIHLSRGGVTVD